MEERDSNRRLRKGFGVFLLTGPAATQLRDVRGAFNVAAGGAPNPGRPRRSLRLRLRLRRTHAC